MKDFIKKLNRFYNDHLIVRLIVVFALCVAAGLVFNRKVEFRSLFLDDLDNYHPSLSMSFFEYAFGIYGHQVHYRPVFYGAFYLISKIITGHVGWVYAINTVIQSILGTTVYYVLEKLEVKKVIAFITALLFMAAHFSYHHIAQMIGPIESISLFFAVLILYTSIRYIYLDRDKKKTRDYIAILIFYTLISFTHERYLGLIIPIALAVAIDTESKKTKIRRIIIAVAVFAAIMLLRYILLGRIIPAGTDRSNLANSFTLGNAIIYALEQVAMVFGFNIGPAHLVGIDFVSASAAAKAVIIISCIFLLILVATYFVAKFRTSKECTGLYGRDFRIDIIIVVSIVMYICSSSVNPRLEMRWVYVSFTAALIYGMYMFTYISRHGECFEKASVIKTVMVVVLLGFFATRFGVEAYYHSYYDNIYVFMYLKPMNSLSDQTARRYPKEYLDNTKIYLISNRWDFSVEQMQIFYEPFFGERYDGKETFVVIQDELDALVDDMQEMTGTEIAPEEYNQMYHDLIKQHVYEDNAMVFAENYETKTYEQLMEFE